MKTLYIFIWIAEMLKSKKAKHLTQENRKRANRGKFRECERMVKKNKSRNQ